MAPQTRRRIDPFGSGTYLRGRAETDRAALLGLGRPRKSRRFPIDHLGTSVLVPIGRVGRPHGLDGAFVVERASPDDRRWEVGGTVLVDGVPATIVLSRRAGGSRRAIRLDREVPRGVELTVDASELPPPDPDSFYVFQLIGLDAVDEDGAALGRVVEVHPGAANDNVELEDGTLVPLVEDAVRDIDLAAGRLVVARGFLV